MVKALSRQRIVLPETGQKAMPERTRTKGERLFPLKGE
jgi:hypothetical protein